MDLPEAIRVGSSMTKQTSCLLAKFSWSNEVHACGWGAAVVGLMGLPWARRVLNEPDVAKRISQISSVLRQAWPDLFEYSYPVGRWIRLANDVAGWTREAIADAVEAHLNLGIPLPALDERR